MDDRGVVYVRFGKPISTFSYAQRRKDVEAWLYRDTDGHNFSFYFDRGRVAADVISAMGSISADPAGKDMEAFEDLAQMDARYGFVVARLQSIHTYAFGRGTSSYNPQAIADRSEDIIRLNERISSDNAIRMGEEIGSDRAVPVFAKPLPVFHDFASFRGNGCTDVVYSILAQSNAYQLNVAVADTFTWETESVDTRVARGGLADSWLRATGVFCTFPRNNAYMRFTVASDDDRGVTAGGEIHIADYRGSDFMMSDLLFATTQPGPFVRGNAHLALVPPRQFKEGEAFRVFYELYNLPRGGRYKTEITFTTLESGLLMRVFRGHKQTTVSFDDEAQTDNVVQELRTLVPQVEPGRVEVKITVTDLASGQKATSKENIRILPKSM